MQRFEIVDRREDSSVVSCLASREQNTHDWVYGVVGKGKSFINFDSCRHELLLDSFKCFDLVPRRSISIV